MSIFYFQAVLSLHSILTAILKTVQFQVQNVALNRGKELAQGHSTKNMTEVGLRPSRAPKIF